jgi:hypothetical protein
MGIVLQKRQVDDIGVIGVGDDRSVKTKDANPPQGLVDIEKGRERTSLDNNNSDEDSPSSSSPRQAAMRGCLLPALIFLVGVAACALILGIGISAASNEQDKQFKRVSTDLVHQVGKAWEEYKSASLWVQQASRSGKESREEFHTLYRYLRATGLGFNSIAYLTNVTHDERATCENDTRTFMEESYPEVPYDGFKREENDTVISYYDETRPFYFPAHYVEPLEKHWDWLDLDFYATPRLGLKKEKIYLWDFEIPQVYFV